MSLNHWIRIGPRRAHRSAPQPRKWRRLLIGPEKEGRPLPKSQSAYFRKRLSNSIGLRIGKTHRRGNDRSTADSLERTEGIERDVVCDVTCSEKGRSGSERNVD